MGHQPALTLGSFLVNSAGGHSLFCAGHLARVHSALPDPFVYSESHQLREGDWVNLCLVDGRGIGGRLWHDAVHHSQHWHAGDVQPEWNCTSDHGYRGLGLHQRLACTEVCGAGGAAGRRDPRWVFCSGVGSFPALCPT